MLIEMEKGKCSKTSPEQDVKPCFWCEIQEYNLATNAVLSSYDKSCTV